MKRRNLFVVASMAAAYLAVWPTQAASQSANDPLSSISEEDFLNSISLIRPPLKIEREGERIKLTLPNGVEANAKLQNCEGQDNSRNCRTLSIIVNLLAPDGKSREELLGLVNELNKTDIHGRTFLNDNNEIVARWTFFATGHESSRGLAAKLINWDAFVRRAVMFLYATETER